MYLGPVFWMEMRTGARRARHYFTRAFVVGVIFAIVICAWLSFLEWRAMSRGQYGRTSLLLDPLMPDELPQLGRKIFAAYSLTQFMLVLLLAPLYTAGAVAADRERRVLELLLTTDLRNIELIASKFLVRAIHLCAFVAASLPVMFLCLLLGGVSAEDLLVTFALTLAAVLFVASLGLLISIGARRAYGAVVVTFLILLVAWLALPAVALLILFTGGTGAVSGWVSDCGLAIISLNPIVALMNVVIDGGGPPGMWVDSHWVCTATYGSSALLLMLINVVVIRRFGLWASRERVVRDRKRDRRRRVRQVWSNPVAWREVRTIVIHRRMRWARILSLVFSFMFSAIVWLGWVADWWDHRPALTMDIEQVCGVIACTATVAWVLMALQGSVSFSHEREHSTLDALLTTPLAGYQIVLGKMQGILRSSAFALAFPIGFTLLTWFRHLTSLRAAVWTIAAILVVGVFAACLGLAASVRLGSSGKACGLAAGVILFLCVGLPMASSSFISYNGRHAWLPLTHVSPAENVCWSAYDEDVRGDVRYLHRYIENYRNWSGRFAISAVHVGVELLVAVVLVGWSVATVEEQWRVRQLWFPRWFRLEQVSPGLPPALVEDR